MISRRIREDDVPMEIQEYTQIHGPYAKLVLGEQWEFLRQHLSHPEQFEIIRYLSDLIAANDHRNLDMFEGQVIMEMGARITRTDYA